ncbi:MAG: glutathione S-transferase [Zoogloeaceae bacterium]|jgi:glutathione S-transferase|nr:glutathione S-transferase [Zoogloeaceae bacterium]
MNAPANLPAITLYGTPTSGHTHRVELLLRILELPYAYSEAPEAVRRSAAFRQRNPLGQIPVLQDGERVLCDSNAILIYLAKRYAPHSGWWPEEAEAAARVQRWLSIAAGELKHGPAAARLMVKFNAPGDLAAAHAIADTLLEFMEQHLTKQQAAGRRFLALDTPTLADLACYAYIAHAPEGGIALAPYPHVCDWLTHIERLPRFQPMPGLPER